MISRDVMAGSIDSIPEREQHTGLTHFVYRYAF